MHQAIYTVSPAPRERERGGGVGRRRMRERGERDRDREREGERKSLPKISPISPEAYREEKDIWFSSSSLSKSFVITLKLSLKIKSDYNINSIFLYLCSSL